MHFAIAVCNTAQLAPQRSYTLKLPCHPCTIRFEWSCVTSILEFVGLCLLDGKVSSDCKYFAQIFILFFFPSSSSAFLLSFRFAVTHARTTALDKSQNTLYDKKGKYQIKENALRLCDTHVKQTTKMVGARLKVDGNYNVHVRKRPGKCFHCKTYSLTQNCCSCVTRRQCWFDLGIQQLSGRHLCTQCPERCQTMQISSDDFAMYLSHEFHVRREGETTDKLENLEERRQARTDGQYCIRDWCFIMPIEGE